MSISISKLSLNTENKDLKEYRCPKCSKIPLFTVYINDNKLYISAKCTNNHSYPKQPFNEMKKMCIEYPIKNYVCEVCDNEKNKEKKNDINYYCPTCFKFFCIAHGKLHGLNAEHKAFLFTENFDNVCHEHKGNSVIGYCV